MSLYMLPTLDLVPIDAKVVHPKLPLRTAGVLGGLAPQSTSLFYEEITRICLDRSLPAHPRLLLNSVNTWEVVDILNRRDLDQLYRFLIREIEFFVDEADFMLMICNSVHAVLPHLRKRLSIPILAIHEEVVKNIALQNVRRVGILGTRTTINQAFYQSELASYGIDYRILPPDQVAYFDQFIFEEMLHGRGLGTMRQLILDGISAFEDQGCEGVILGCTELPLFLCQKETEMPIFASTQILAQATVDTCLGYG